MKPKQLLFFFTLQLLCTAVFAQETGPAKPYSIVIKGGHIIDPKNNVDAVIDIAIKDGKIAAIAKNIDGGKIVYNLNGIAEPNVLPATPRQRTF